VSWTPSVDPDLPDGYPGSGTSSYQYRYGVNGGSMGAWQTTYSPTFTIPGTAAGETIAVDVVPVDGAGNQGPTTSGTLVSGTADNTPPVLTLNDGLPAIAGGTADGGMWDVWADATDDSGSGVAKISATVNGQPMTDDGQTTFNGWPVGVQAQSCATSGCDLDMRAIFETTEYPEGPTTVTVTATDFAGNSSSQSVSFTNSWGAATSGVVALRDKAISAGPDYEPFAAGKKFDGLRMTSAMRYRESDGTAKINGGPRADYITYDYGDCDTSEGGCQPPIEVQSAALKERNVSAYNDPSVLATYKKIRLRGVPAASFDHGKRIELYTGQTSVTVYGKEPKRVMKFARVVAPVVRSSDIPRIGENIFKIHNADDIPARLPKPTFDPTAAKATAKAATSVTTVWNTPLLSYGGSDCSGDGTDPINVLVTGQEATASNVNARMSDRGWGNTDQLAGSKQSYVDPGSANACRGQQGQNATSNGLQVQFWNPGSKDHIRQFEVGGTQNGGVHVVAGDAHVDSHAYRCGKVYVIFGNVGIGDYVAASYNGGSRSGYDQGQIDFNKAWSWDGNSDPDLVSTNLTGTTRGTFSQCNPHGDSHGNPHVQVGWNGHVWVYSAPDSDF
jgi:hypothetical protein